jgi:hypothetical protein
MSSTLKIGVVILAISVFIFEAAWLGLSELSIILGLIGTVTTLIGVIDTSTDINLILKVGLVLLAVSSLLFELFPYKGGVIIYLGFVAFIILIFGVLGSSTHIGSALKVGVVLLALSVFTFEAAATSLGELGIILGLLAVVTIIIGATDSSTQLDSQSKQPTA